MNASTYQDGDVYWAKIRGGIILPLHYFNSNWFQFGGEESQTVLKVFNKVNEPITKKPKKAKPRSRIDRWCDAASAASEALGELKAVQEEYQEWKDSLPENLAYSGLGEKLDAVCDLDIEGAQSTADEAASAELPLGFGRD